jgi:hypothetical protein
MDRMAWLRGAPQKMQNLLALVVAASRIAITNAAQ